VTRPEGFRRFAPFVVRDRRPAEIMFKSAFNTSQAYNRWGGESLYLDESGSMPGGRAYEVSHNRPFSEADGAGETLYYEYPFVRFLERNGYDVTYSTNADFIRFSDLLNGIGLLAIAGHDEYCTVEERAQVDAALASGRTSLAYFSANGFFWRVRYADDRRGNPLRTIVCYKSDPHLDPIRNSTIRFRDPPNALPENQLFGIMYESWQQVRFPFVVGDPTHWLFEGTGLSAGDQLPNLIGTEFDRVYPELDTPADTRVITESPVVTEQGTASVSHAVERNLPSGNIVFAVGTLTWSDGLNPDLPDTMDDRVAQMTRNVMERGLAHRRSRRPPGIAGAIRGRGPVIDGRWAPAVEAFAGIARRRGWADGPASACQFSGPTGLACLPSGQVLVADTNNHRIRLIDTDPQRTVRTIAGNGVAGFANGVGAQAMFRKPNALAIAPDGAILVADSENHVVRRIENNSPNWTVTVYAGTPATAGFANGAALSARFIRPTGIALDRAGNLYVTEVGGNRVRMIRADSREVTTYAGTGAFGWRDAPSGVDAQFSAPSAVAVAPTGEVYVLDAYLQYLRRISPRDAHPVDTIAGSPYSADGDTDGLGSQARFRAQLGMVVLSPSGEIILADSANFRIRKLIPGADAASTRVYTIAGSGRNGTRLGRGDEADIVAPTGLALAPNGTLIVSDSYNHVIRRIIL
jgi:sugar lactone lactonase YvrE